MTIEKQGNKLYKITDIINGYLVSRVYYYYTRKQAIINFKKEFGI